MRNIDENTITRAVIASFDNCEDARLKTVMTSLVQHLHAFAREVNLSGDEWLKAISFLTEAGHITDAKRQEFILLSDTLGLSMLVTTQNNRKPAVCTEATVWGPFFVENAPVYQNGDDISAGARGAPCYVSGQVRGIDGAPVSQAWLDVWQSDEAGFYDVQRPVDARGNSTLSARGRLQTDADGRFNFWSILAEAYPIPHDGPVGRMLLAAGRHPWRPAHLHFMIQAPGYDTLVTHVFRDGDKYLDSDVVFGVRSTLITEWVRHEPGLAPDGKVRDATWYSLDYDFVLNPSRSPA
ncbi:MAG: intradiol ring-cleavage dioxygenase [Janthinobacterium lividum]